MQITVGQAAPDFNLVNDLGETVKLADLRGKKVVLYFYPKDDTPGCTREACAFRDGLKELAGRNAVVFGVSADTVSSHQKFKDKYKLNFPLLSDDQKTALEAYGVWKEKNLYGRKSMGIERTTFIIDEDGKIARIFPRVKVDGHFDEVLQALS